MRCALPILVVACLLGAGLAGPGCGSGEPGNCGRALSDGRFRFCSDEGGQVCICSTGRCAVDDYNCESNYRYVYGDEECVPVGERSAGGFVMSGDETAACFDVPTGRPARQVASTEQVDPRLVRLGDHVLVETVTPYPVGVSPINPAADTRVQAHLIDCGGQSVPGTTMATLPLEPSYGDAIAVRGADSWGLCDIDRESGLVHSALFVHWVMLTRDEWQPFVARATLQSSGPQLEDKTLEVLGTTPGMPTSIQALRVVGTVDGCWVTWIEDSDGSGGDMPAVVRAARVNRNGSVQPVLEDLFIEPDQRDFVAVPMLSDDAGRYGLMAGDDGLNGLVVAVPYEDSDGTVGLWAQRVPAEALRPVLSGGQSIAAFRSGTADCDGDRCLGIEEPQSGGIAAQEQDETLHFGFVLVGPPAPPPEPERRTLWVARAPRELARPAELLRIELPSPVRGVTIVPRPEGGIFGAVMGWNGSVTASEAQLHLFRLSPEGPVSWPVAAPRAFLPQLAVDDHGHLMTGFVTMETTGSFGLRLLRSDRTTLEPAPTWPADGVPFQPDGARLGGDPSSSVAPPFPRAEGGALVAWTTPDDHVNVAAVEAVF